MGESPAQLKKRPFAVEICVLFFPPMSTGPKFQPGHHAAKFYETESSLYATVATFLSEGFAAGQPAIVIATPVHTEAIERLLTDRGIDVPRARRTGDMVVLDAEDTLGTFMISGRPDAELFEYHVGSILEQVLRGRRTRRSARTARWSTCSGSRDPRMRRSSSRSSGTSSRSVRVFAAVRLFDGQLLQAGRAVP